MTRVISFQAKASWLACCLAPVLFFTNPAFAAESATESVAERPIEEIQVIGERNLISLQLEIYDAEVQMYDMFNDLNSTDDYDVTCRYLTPTGTLIRQWTCDAGFMTRERFQNVQDFLQFGIIQRTDEQMYWENRHKVEALNAELIAVAKENPALAKAMLDLHAKRERLEDLQLSRREATKGFFGRLFGKNTGDD